MNNQWLSNSSVREIIAAVAFLLFFASNTIASGTAFQSFKDALKAAKVQEVNALLDTVGDVNLTNEDGISLLHLASQIGRKDVCASLIVRGANVNAADNSGDTPLHDANNVSIAALLLAHGADLERANSGGRTPLFHAVVRRDLSMAAFLLSNSARVDSRSSTGASPLIIAALNGDKDMMLLLLKNHATVTVADNDGNTTLHEAVRSKSVDAVKLLIAFGADPRVRDQKGDSSLHLATRIGSLDIVKLLVEDPAMIGALNSAGLTAIDIAKETKRDKIAEFLMFRLSEK